MFNSKKNSYLWNTGRLVVAEWSIRITRSPGSRLDFFSNMGTIIQRNQIFMTTLVIEISSSFPMYVRMSKQKNVKDVKPNMFAF